MWYEKLDFDENPFKNGDLINYQDLIDEILYTISSGNILFIEGKEGTGKTALLKEAIKKFGGKGKIAYIDCNKVDNPNIEDVITKKSSFFAKLSGKKPKDMIVL